MKKGTTRKYTRKDESQALAGQPGVGLGPGTTGARGGGLSRGKKKRGGTDVTAGDGAFRSNDSNQTVFASNPFEDDQPIKLIPQHQIHTEPPPLNHLHDQSMHHSSGHLTPGSLQHHQHYATSGGPLPPVQNHHMHPHLHAHHQPSGPYGGSPNMAPQMQQPPPHHTLSPGGGLPQMMRAGGPPPSQSHMSAQPLHPLHHHQVDNHMIHQQQPIMTSPSPPRPQMYGPSAGGYGSQSPMNAMPTTQQQQLPQPPHSMTPGQQQPQHYPPSGPPQQQLPPNQPNNLYCFHCRQPIFPNEQSILCRPGCENYYHRQCSGLTELAYSMLMKEEPTAQWACNNCFQNDRVQIPFTRPYTQHQEMDNRQSLWS